MAGVTRALPLVSLLGVPASLVAGVAESLGPGVANCLCRVVRRGIGETRRLGLAVTGGFVFGRPWPGFGGDS